MKSASFSARLASFNIVASTRDAGGLGAFPEKYLNAVITGARTMRTNS